jgi:glutathione peroxidase
MHPTPCSVLRSAAACALVAGALLPLASCGDPGARDQKPAQREAHNHKEGESCPLCEGIKQAEAEAAAKKAQQAPTPAPAPAPAVLSGTVQSIDGKDIDLASYTGKVVLVVNVASRCGLTGQYEGLQKLYQDKQAQGLVILGFPANNFMGQEPGTNEQIAEFCQTKFNVTFPMFAKIDVVGDTRHPLFARLAQDASKLPEAAGGTGGDATKAEPTWNFTKYLIGRDGQLAARFGPRTKPTDDALVAKVDALLKTPAPGR